MVQWIVEWGNKGENLLETGSLGMFIYVRRFIYVHEQREIELKWLREWGGREKRVNDMCEENVLKHLKEMKRAKPTRLDGSCGWVSKRGREDCDKMGLNIT